MAKLPVISGKEAVRAFEKDGWKIVRRARSRHIMSERSVDPAIGAQWNEVAVNIPSALNFLRETA